MPGAIDPTEPVFRVMHSSTRRFLAAGPDSAVALQTLIFAEDVADRLERRLGASLPAQPGNPLRIRFRVDDKAGEAMIVRRRVHRGGSVVQHIFITNPATADPEEFLEALVAELLDRYLWVRQPASAWAGGPAAFPAWFSIGCAQDLYPALRARNHALLRRRLVRGEPPSLSMWLTDEPDQQRRPLARAVWGVAFEWLRSGARFGERFESWALQWAMTEALEPSALFSDAVGRTLTSRMLEVEWQLWLAAQGDFLRGWGHADEADVLELHRRLSLPARAVPGVDPAVVRWVTPENLLRLREEPWAREGAVTLRRGLARLQSGARGPEFHAIVQSFDRVLAALAGPTPRRRTVPALEQALHDARRDLAALEAALAEAAWKRQAAEGAGYLGRDPPADLAERLQRHLDALEQEAPPVDPGRDREE